MDHLWLIIPATDERIQFTDTRGGYQWPAWSPDDTHLATI